MFKWIVPLFLLVCLVTGSSGSPTYAPAVPPAEVDLAVVSPSEDSSDLIGDQVQAISSNDVQQTAIRGIVCIDPGHQRRGNREQELVGPDSAIRKDKVSSGTTGVKTKKPEYELTLEVGLKLRDRLTEIGYQVVMTRETHDVDISNKERAILCNDAGADLSLRLHADGAETPSAQGISVLYPSGANSASARSMAAALLQTMIETTGAVSRGVTPRSDLTGFNWSTVPSLLVEMGFMTNPEEDRKLSDPAYQDLLVEGMFQFVADL